MDSYRSFLAKRYGHWAGIAQDGIPKEGSLEAHDRRHHPHGYKRGDKCKFRETLAKSDEVDDIGDGGATNTAEKGRSSARNLGPLVKQAAKEVVEYHNFGRSAPKWVEKKEQEIQRAFNPREWDDVVKADAIGQSLREVQKAGRHTRFQPIIKAIERNLPSFTQMRSTAEEFMKKIQKAAAPYKEREKFNVGLAREIDGMVEQYRRLCPAFAVCSEAREAYKKFDGTPMMQQPELDMQAIRDASRERPWENFESLMQTVVSTDSFRQDTEQNEKILRDMLDGIADGVEDPVLYPQVPKAVQRSARASGGRLAENFRELKKIVGTDSIRDKKRLREIKKEIEDAWGEFASAMYDAMEETWDE